MSKLYYIANIRMPTDKAHGVQIMNMCQSFARAHAEVELVVPSRSTSIMDDPYDYYGVEKKFKIKRIWCLDWVRFGRLGFWYEIWSFTSSAALYALNKDGIFYTREWLVAFWLKLYGKNVVWEIHTARKNIFIRALLWSGIKTVAITGGLKDYYEKLGAKNVLVAHDGVDLERFKIQGQNNHGKTVFGYIGKYKTMGETKGVDEIVEAFLGLSNKQTELKIVGLNPNESLAKDPRVTAIQHLSPKEIPAHLQTCDALIMNYPASDHYSYYMSPLKLFEYMAAGRTIITSDLPSIREVVSDKEVYYFKAGDTLELRKAMEEVLRNPTEASAKARLAREKVEEYTWDKRAKTILDFINA